MTALPKPLVAEFIGTFFLIFMGAGAATALGANHDPAVAFAHGFAILVAVAAFGDISGGHINPAVTIGLTAAGEFPLGREVRLTASCSRNVAVGPVRCHPKSVTKSLQGHRSTSLIARTLVAERASIPGTVDARASHCQPPIFKRPLSERKVRPR